MNLSSSGFKLSKKLFEIAKLVEGRVVADIGCDHGFLPIWLALKKDGTKIFACDVRKKPLQKAKENAKKFGVFEKIEFVLSDGLLNVPEIVDCVIVSGMGGKLIERIIFEKDFVKNDIVKLILQPQSFVFELREALFSNGFKIEKEVVLKEKNKWYNVLVARFCGKREKISQKEKVLGKLLEGKNFEVLSFLEHCYLKEQRILNDMKKSLNCDEMKIAQKEKVCEILKEQLI